MPVYLPVSLLLAQCAVLLLGRPIEAPAAYLAMVAAPLLAAAAAAARARREAAGARRGWSAIALALVIWAFGAFGNLWQEWVLGHVNEMYRSSMIAFNLATVPIAFLLATDWHSGGRHWVRLIDAVLALALGCVYYLVTWTMIAEQARPDEIGVAYLVWLLDAQNLFLTVGALVRWHVAEDKAERDLFRALSIYSVSYLVIAFVNDHFFAPDPAYGPQYGSIVTAAFALLSAFALSAPSTAPIRPAGPRMVRGVRTGAPIVLCGALLIVSLFLIRMDYPYGCAGIVIAALGYGLRTTLTQVRHLERGDRLQQQRSELQAIARTDALTGVANRYRLDEELHRAFDGRHSPRHALSLLMIDIDHFKLLNDRCGHLAGDACLRGVARALRQTLLRPDDLLARYGGEEFIALLRGVDADGARTVAERMCLAVRELRIENAGSPMGVVTVSIGVAASMAGVDCTPEGLIAAADRALYEAKCTGRNRALSARPSRQPARPIGEAFSSP